jgi:hypothetical protein
LFNYLPLFLGGTFHALNHVEFQEIVMAQSFLALIEVSLEEAVGVSTLREWFRVTKMPSLFELTS